MDEGLTGGEDGFIVVRGARAHNLRDVSVRFPRGRMTVVTGVSGSGKSSLAFDTVFAEGQRRYLESPPPHARQFLDRLERPDVDYVGGLAPAIAIGRPTAAAGCGQAPVQAEGAVGRRRADRTGPRARGRDDGSGRRDSGGGTRCPGART